MDVDDVADVGKHFPGLHEPTISEKLFNRVQRVRRKRAHERGKAPRKSRVFPVTRGAGYTGCRFAMRGNSASGYRYLGDPATDQDRNCDQRQVRAQGVEDALGDLLRA